MYIHLEKVYKSYVMFSKDLWSKEVFKRYCSKEKQLCKILSSSHQWHTMSDFYGDMQDETDIWVILRELSFFQKIDMTLSFYVIPLNFRRPNIIFFFAYNCYYNICKKTYHKIGQGKTTIYRQKENYIQSILKSKNSKNEEMWKWGILSLSKITQLPQREEVEDKGRIQSSGLPFANPYINLLELYVILVRKIKSRQYRKTVSLTKHADTLRKFDSTTVST